MSSIVVLGPGGVGGFLAAALARAGEDVAAVGREHEAEVIARDGISVDSRLFGSFTARLPVSTELSRPADVLLVATKAPTLPEALERIRTPPGLVVPLLNGFEHVATLRAYFGVGQVAAGVIRMETDCPAPGHVIQSSPGVRVELAVDDPARQPELSELAERFTRAGIPAQIGASEAQVLWSKLVRLAPLACTTSVADEPIGFIRSDPHWRSVLCAVIDEVVAVANAEGARIDPATPLAELESAHATLGSSMQRDLAAGREPEVEAIPGAVLRAGARHGIDCPTLASLATAIAERAGLPVPAGL